jgi:hypothetical protein
LVSQDEKEDEVMPQYYVEVRVDFSGYIEAENAEEAEQKAFTAWGEELGYDGVYSVDVDDSEDEEEED